MAYIFVYAIFCNFPSYTFGAWSAQKKREVRLFFTLYKGFAIPQLVEKQPKSTPVYTPHIFTPDGLACPETLRWRDITTADG